MPTPPAIPTTGGILTTADWIGFVIGVVALTISIAAFARTFEGRVRWEIVGEATGQVRLINRSERFTAVISYLGDADLIEPDGAKRRPIDRPSLTMTTDDKYPITLDPGNGFPFIVHQILGRPRMRVKVTWRQRHFNGRWLRPIKRTTYLYA